MKKDRFYFPHDYFARSDIKIKKLIREMGHEGYGIYWELIEMLHENSGTLPTDLDQLAFDLRVKKSKIEKILKDFELFEVESDFFTSNRVSENIAERENKSVKARESILKRYERNTNEVRPYNDSTTIKEKEKKGKEIKVKESKEEEIKEEIVPSHENHAPLVVLSPSDPFSDLWQKWKSYRRSIKKPIKPETEVIAIEKLRKMAGDNIDTATDIVETSIMNGWQGLFPAKNGGTINVNGHQFSRNGPMAKYMEQKYVKALKEKEEYDALNQNDSFSQPY